METMLNGFEYYGAWFKKMNVKFNSKDYEVDIQINGYDEEELPETGEDAFVSFMNRIDTIPSIIGDAVLDYYKNKREELGYDVETNEDYPDYRDANSVLDTLKLIGITIPAQDDYDERAIFLVFDCSWDVENGVGVCIIGNSVEEVGPQGIAL